MRPAPLLIAALMLLVAGIAAAADIPPGQAALFAAQEKAKGKPPEEVARIYKEDVIDAYPGSLYAGQALLNIGSVYMENKQYDKALELTEQALREYGSTYLASQGVRRKFAILLYALGKPKEALEFLDEAMAQYGKQIPSRDAHWIPAYRYDAHMKLGDKQAALKALQEAIIGTPEVLDSWEFHRRVIPALQGAGKRREMQSAAKGAYACCKFADAEVEKVVELVVKSFVGNAEVFKANQFLAAQEDAEAENPLQEVPWPEALSEEQWKQVWDNCRRDEHLWVVALLYHGKVDQALEVATLRLGSAGDAEKIAGMHRRYRAVLQGQGPASGAGQSVRDVLQDRRGSQSAAGLLAARARGAGPTRRRRMAGDVQPRRGGIGLPSA